jgi:hypothetical protein
MAETRGAPLTSFLWSENLKPATKPCVHPTGSAGRIATYRARFERGEQLFHEGDAKTTVAPDGNGQASKPKEISLQEIDLSKLVA